MKYKALILDVDGTTITTGLYSRPSRRVVDAVKKAKELVHVSTATGRAFPIAKHITDELQLTSPSIFSGGTKIIDPISHKTLWEKFMSKEKVEEILRIARQFPYTIIPNSHYDYLPPRMPYRLQQEVLIEIDEVPFAESEPILAALEQIQNIHLTTVKQYGLDDIVINITDKEGTKGKALQHLKKMLGVTTEEVIGIGDSYNDPALFEEVGLKIAMGNAVPELQERADYVTSHVEQDGLAEAIEKFILEPQSFS